MILSLVLSRSSSQPYILSRFLSCHISLSGFLFLFLNKTYRHLHDSR